MPNHYPVMHEDQQYGDTAKGIKLERARHCPDVDVLWKTDNGFTSLMRFGSCNLWPLCALAPAHDVQPL